MSPLKLELLVDTETFSKKHGANVNITFPHTDIVLSDFNSQVSIRGCHMQEKSHILVDGYQVDDIKYTQVHYSMIYVKR